MNEETGEREGVPRPKSSKKKILLVGCSLLGAATALVFLWYFRGPAEGTVRIVENVSKEAKSETLPPKRFEGKYFSFSYPADYVAREVDSDVVSAEKGLFVASGSASRIIAFSVQEMVGKTLSDIPSYQLRSMVKKSEYRRLERKTDAFDAVVFVTSEGGYEKTAFVSRGGVLLTLSVSSQALADPKVIETDFETVFASLRFDQ